MLLVASFGLAQDRPAAVVLGPGDVVAVTVFGQEKYSGEFTVMEDGTLSGPGFGRIVASGRTIEQVESTIVDAFKRIFKDPRVTVFIKTQANSLVYVIGSLRDVGTLTHVPGRTLLELVLSVGLPADPDLLEATLYRRGGETFPIDLEALLRGDESQWNGEILPYDSLIILPKRYIRVTISPNGFGAPGGKSGEMRLPAGVDLYAALAEAGGVGNLNGHLLDEINIIVRRGSAVHTLPAKQNPTQPLFALQSGDSIFVQGPDMIRVTVSGEVIEPREVTVQKDTTITGVLALAKGITPQGLMSDVVVLRGNEAYRVNARGPVEGRAGDGFALQNNDVVFVRPNERALFALGTVTNPGRYLIPDAEEWRASELLARAGGLAEGGTLRRVVLIRPDENGRFVPREFHLDDFLKHGREEANPALQPGDILMFGQPRGITIGNASSIVSSALLLTPLLRR
jgi:polysaccharide biosynthesis/export protein